MPHFTCPQLPWDGLLRRAAARAPHAPALTTGRGTVTFGQLDAHADRIARFLAARAAGRGPVVVGVAASLDALFPAAVYGTSRSGNTVALINPLADESTLHHLCTAAGVEIALVPAAVAEPLARIRGRLPLLHTVLVTDADAGGAVPEGALALHTVLDTVSGGPYASAAPDLSAVACLQFTTGTTRRPRGVRLTHRNLVANAAQTALAQGLGPGSVTLNHLPLFHLMHLNSAVYAGASQVLCHDPDPVASLALAARAGATHYYGLPARLHRLAADARLDTAREGIPAGPRLTALMSGGTALAPEAARRLRRALGVPVIQGYGLAELSPLSHMQRPHDPVLPGAVGPPLPGTRCRVVDLRSRAAVPAGTAGEVQVRGPQVMAGYLDDGEPSPIDAQGWLSTGDVGLLDDDGRLFLVDRIDDVFTCDSQLVSPTGVERVIAEDPRVADCAVVAWPDAEHGAVVWAGIVLCGPPGAARHTARTLEAIVRDANGRLAPSERIHRAQALDTVPRTRTGKPERQALRESVRARAAAEAGA
ncbi:MULTISPECIES: class I adenylate-forming enzyme family protein [unclassified Streptomyces]|uniref:class I adenylate-forming enzyme family protein n=1 Tax=unclassified Streptomyces TaxID=2593676 RepID=UPI00225BB0E8|nr:MULTISPECIES: class I adenylate-forming enzyme family protein [unclassified Streptomyces]MCX4993179.1 acyl--CoA ligase [Streptomyces sp. NBC_00568]MCX5009383.1 acyl--CoA ligase [Streptomyces sp. NBC_00638]